MNKISSNFVWFIGGGLIVGFVWVFFSLFFDQKRVLDIDHKSNPNNTIVIVDKDLQQLTVYDGLLGKIKTFNVSTGLNPGNKLMRGDSKTPEGFFPVIGIEESSDWTYDFQDGMGPIVGAYGPFFLRLRVNNENLFKNVGIPFEFTSKDGFTGIGIHGTHLDTLIGQRASHGCIRLKNDDLIELKKLITPGTIVGIVPGKKDFDENINPIFTK